MTRNISQELSPRVPRSASKEDRPPESWQEEGASRSGYSGKAVRKSEWRFLRKLIIELPHPPAITLVCHASRGSIISIWKRRPPAQGPRSPAHRPGQGQPECPPAGDGQEHCGSHTRGTVLSPGKKDVCHLNSTMALGDATLGDIGQTGRDKHGVIHAESKE